MIRAVKRSRRNLLLRLLPFYGLIAGAVFLRGHVHFPAERLPQVALGREMHVLRDLGDGLVGIPQQIRGPLDPHLHDIVLQTDPGIPLEEPREVGGADPQLLRDIIEIQLLPVMPGHVGPAGLRVIGNALLLLFLPDPLRQIPDRVIPHAEDLRRGGLGAAFSDVIAADAVGALGA